MSDDHGLPKPLEAKFLTAHCSATPNGHDVSVADIRGWHLARGFRDIGYHKIIGIDGTVYDGRPLTDQGAHVEGHNEGNIGICMIGTNKYTMKQFEMLLEVSRTLVRQFKLCVWDIYCHNQFDTAIRQGKTCPGFPVEVLIPWVVNGKESVLAPYLLKDGE